MSFHHLTGSFALAFSLLLFAGCNSTPTPASSQPAPSPQQSNNNASPWWLNPPADTPTDLFAVGFGTDPVQARRDAVTQLAAKLSTAVSSAFEQTITEQTGAVDSLNTTARLRTRQVVGNLNLNQHQVVQRAVDGNTHVALVKVNKALLLRDAQTRFQDLQQRLQTRLPDSSPPPDADPYQTLRSLGTLSSEAQSLHRLAFLLISLGQSPESVQNALQLARQADQAFRNYLQNHLFVISNSPDSKELAALLRDALVARGADVRLRLVPIPPEAMVIRLRGFTRIVPDGDAFAASLSRQLSLHQGPSTYFSDEWSASATAPSRTAASAKAQQNLLAQWIDSPDLSFLGW